MSAVPSEIEYQSAITPSGIVVDYWPGPKPKRHYRVNGAEVPSVTSVLDVIDKSGPLIWWGMKVGTEGVLELIRRGEIGKLHGEPVLTGDAEDLQPATKENVVPLLTKHKLTTNHQKDRAGDRGTSVHRAFELYLELGEYPNLSLYPAEELPYVTGLLLFLQDLRLPLGETPESEVMVGSVDHRYAGRFDCRTKIQSCELCVDAKKQKFEVFSAGRVLLDLKSSAGFYQTHDLQLEAYELASIECGYHETDYRMVVRVTAEGYYEVKRSTATAEDFLTIRATYDVVKGKK